VSTNQPATDFILERVMETFCRRLSAVETQLRLLRASLQNPVEPARPRRRRCRLRIRGREVVLDGRAVRLGLTERFRAVALTLLQLLLENLGEWITGHSMDAEATARGLARGDWSYTLRKLPGSLQALIDSERGKGFRLREGGPPAPPGIR
jgi:hypothetical protein